MTLTKKLAVKHAVILASNFNPTIFNQLWLIENGFLDREDLLPSSIFSADAVQIRTSKVNILVIPPQMQFGPVDNAEWDETFDILLRMIGRLPEIPYTAAGINFNWFVTSNDLSIEKLSRELFYSTEVSILNEFESEDSRFGIYVSKDFKGARLKLDIKPVIAQNRIEKTTEEVIQFAFNFHKDLESHNPQGLRHSQLLDFLRDHQVYMTEAKRLMEIVEI